ncbi:site-specific integrase [Pseudomonas chlororaphis]|uniref:site-specific integrase n=1 Tax=Pseudomonas chlororaphis TaxID=587753 RepID=UPI0023683CFD|nr:site-specific integrase [Pseudomonas chlororaphis]WDG50134.1 site-specific integrase [Pseudomonas chlororaphis]
MIRLSDATQLAITLPNLHLWSTDLTDRVLTKEANNLPFLTWPDQTPCTPANLYMLTLRDRPGRGSLPLSRRGNKGGTIGAHARKISQLLRFCYYNKKDLLELTDSDFTNFINCLRKEKSTTNFMLNQKNENTLREAGRVCLDFLSHTGAIAGKKGFVSETGVIRVTFIDYIIKIRSGRLITRQKMHHHSFSAGEGGDLRSPITDESIEALRRAIDTDTTSRFVNQRRHLQLSFLEYLGPRRGELGEITVKSIIKASKMKYPMLEMNVYKQGKKVVRLAPITNMLLNQAIAYLEIHRAGIITKFTKGSRPDHGLLFVKQATGAPLADTTLTNTLHDLRRAAGIESGACAHMFRHAFCTNLFVTLFERHRINNPESFETRLMTDEALFSQIRQWTGHATIEGLMPYIQKAYHRIANIGAIISAGHLALVQREFDAHLESKLTEFEHDAVTKADFISSIRQLIHARSADLVSAEPPK